MTFQKILTLVFSVFLGACASSSSIRAPSSSTEDLTAFEDSFRSENLFDYRAQTIARKGVRGVQQHNKQLLALLSDMQAPAVTGNWKPLLNFDQAHDLFEWLESHPVAGSHKVMKYDPKEQIGFCFGRATAVHLEALGKPYKLHPSAIRKIWVFGPMRGGWGHHVATMVLSSNDSGGSSFMVIDPVTWVISAEEWMEDTRRNYEISAKDPLMYFVTEPSRFGPHPGRYTKIDLFGPDRGNRKADAYRGYFDDLMKKFRIENLGRVPASSEKSRSELFKAFEAEFESVPKIVEKSPEGRDEVLEQMEFDFVKDL